VSPSGLHAPPEYCYCCTIPALPLRISIPTMHPVAMSQALFNLVPEMKKEANTGGKTVVRNIVISGEKPITSNIPNISGFLTITERFGRPPV